MPPSSQSDKRDLYEILGVPRRARGEEIKRAFKKLARKYHPDVNPDDKAAEERFKEISFAAEVLGDPEKRRRYDEFGYDSLAHGFDPEQARAWQRWSQGAQHSPFREQRTSPEDLDEMLSRFFGARPLRRRGRDVESMLAIDLLDAALGRELRIHLPERGEVAV